MNKITKAVLPLTICIIIAGLSGCEPNEPISERQERLYSAENIELKKQITQLEEQCKKDIQAKQKELDLCNEEKTILENQINEDAVKAAQESLADMLAEQLEKLTEENLQLKAQVEELNKKLEK